MTKAHDDIVRTADQIEEEAAGWVVRTDRQHDPEQWSKLAAWLSESPRHRAAFLRLSVAWKRSDQLERLAAIGSEPDNDLLDPERWGSSRDARRNAIVPPAPAPARHDDQPSRRGLFASALSVRLLAASAALALIAVVSVGAWLMLKTSTTQVYSTVVGEFRRIKLHDGSILALNTDSKVSVTYTPGHRALNLLRGEALFTVAHDSSRPFDVSAGPEVVRAVGTEFSMRLQDDLSVGLVVSEGRVAINPPSLVTLAAGNVAKLHQGHLETQPLNDAELARSLAWTSNRLMFQNATLGFIAQEFNRYNTQQLLVADPALAQTRFGGTFRATDPEAFAAAAHQAISVKVTHVRDAAGHDAIRLDRGVP